jgi:hypothetical protein
VLRTDYFFEIKICVLCFVSNQGNGKLLFIMLAGGDTCEETPVPIPNTAVKLAKADGTSVRKSLGE